MSSSILTLSKARLVALLDTLDRDRYPSTSKDIQTMKRCVPPEFLDFAFNQYISRLYTCFKNNSEQPSNPALAKLASDELVPCLVTPDFPQIIQKVFFPPSANTTSDVQLDVALKYIPITLDFIEYLIRVLELPILESMIFVASITAYKDSNKTAAFNHDLNMLSMEILTPRLAQLADDTALQATLRLSSLLPNFIAVMRTNLVIFPDIADFVSRIVSGDGMQQIALDLNLQPQRQPDPENVHLIAKTPTQSNPSSQPHQLDPTSLSSTKIDALKTDALFDNKITDKLAGSLGYTSLLNFVSGDGTESAEMLGSMLIDHLMKCDVDPYGLLDQQKQELGTSLSIETQTLSIANNPDVARLIPDLSLSIFKHRSNIDPQLESYCSLVLQENLAHRQSQLGALINFTNLTHENYDWYRLFAELKDAREVHFKTENFLVLESLYNIYSFAMKGRQTQTSLFPLNACFSHAWTSPNFQFKIVKELIEQPITFINLPAYHGQLTQLGDDDIDGHIQLKIKSMASRSNLAGGGGTSSSIGGRPAVPAHAVHHLHIDDCESKLRLWTCAEFLSAVQFLVSLPNYAEEIRTRILKFACPLSPTILVLGFHIFVQSLNPEPNTTVQSPPFYIEGKPARLPSEPCASLFAEIIESIICDALSDYPSSYSAIKTFWAIDKQLILTPMRKWVLADELVRVTKAITIAKRLNGLPQIIATFPLNTSIDTAFNVQKLSESDLISWFDAAISPSSEKEDIYAFLLQLMATISTSITSSRNPAQTFTLHLNFYTHVFKSIGHGTLLSPHLRDMPASLREKIAVTFTSLSSCAAPFKETFFSSLNSDLSSNKSSVSQEKPGSSPTATTNAADKKNQPQPLNQQPMLQRDIVNQAAQFLHGYLKKTISLEEFLTKMKTNMLSTHPEHVQLYLATINVIVEEYRCFKQYPDEVLRLMAALVGALISRQTLDEASQVKLLTVVLDSLMRTPPEDKVSSKFGQLVLEIIEPNLFVFPEFCERIYTFEHLRPALPEFYLKLEKHMQKVRTALPNPTFLSNSNGGSSSISSNESAFATFTKRSAGNASTGSTKSSATNKFRSITDIQDYLTTKYAHFLRPSQETEGLFLFHINNLDLSSVIPKAKALKSLMFDNKDHLPWFSSLLIVKRILTEANHHALYFDLITTIQSEEFSEIILKHTYINIHLLLKITSPHEAYQSFEKSAYTNLGSWLGLITLGVNKPILWKDLKLKDLLIAYYNTTKFIYLVGLACKALRSCNKSKVFRLPNPWTLAMMRLLREAHDLPDAAKPLQYEITLLFKFLDLPLDSIKPSSHFVLPSTISSSSASTNTSLLEPSASKTVSGSEADLISATNVQLSDVCISYEKGLTSTTNPVSSSDARSSTSTFTEISPSAVPVGGGGQIKSTVKPKDAASLTAPTGMSYSHALLRNTQATNTVASSSSAAVAVQQQGSVLAAPITNATNNASSILSNNISAANMGATGSSTGHYSSASSIPVPAQGLASGTAIMTATPASMPPSALSTTTEPVSHMTMGVASSNITTTVPPNYTSSPVSSVPGQTSSSINQASLGMAATATSSAASENTNIRPRMPPAQPYSSENHIKELVTSPEVLSRISVPVSSAPFRHLSQDLRPYLSLAIGAAVQNTVISSKQTMDAYCLQLQGKLIVLLTNPGDNYYSQSTQQFLANMEGAIIQTLSAFLKDKIKSAFQTTLDSVFITYYQHMASQLGFQISQDYLFTHQAAQAAYMENFDIAYSILEKVIITASLQRIEELIVAAVSMKQNASINMQQQHQQQQQQLLQQQQQQHQQLQHHQVQQSQSQSQPVQQTVQLHQIPPTSYPEIQPYADQMGISVCNLLSLVQTGQLHRSLFSMPAQIAINRILSSRASFGYSPSPGNSQPPLPQIQMQNAPIDREADFPPLKPVGTSSSSGSLNGLSADNNNNATTTLTTSATPKQQKPNALGDTTPVAISPTTIDADPNVSASLPSAATSVSLPSSFKETSAHATAMQNSREPSNESEANLAAGFFSSSTYRKDGSAPTMYATQDFKKQHEDQETMTGDRLTPQQFLKRIHDLLQKLLYFIATSAPEALCIPKSNSNLYGLFRAIDKTFSRFLQVGGGTGRDLQEIAIVRNEVIITIIKDIIAELFRGSEHSSNQKDALLLVLQDLKKHAPALQQIALEFCAYTFIDPGTQINPSIVFTTFCLMKNGLVDAEKLDERITTDLEKTPALMLYAVQLLSFCFEESFMVASGLLAPLVQLPRLLAAISQLAATTPSSENKKILASLIHKVYGYQAHYVNLYRANAINLTKAGQVALIFDEFVRIYNLDVASSTNTAFLDCVKFHHQQRFADEDNLLFFMNHCFDLMTTYHLSAVKEYAINQIATARGNAASSSNANTSGASGNGLANAMNNNGNNNSNNQNSLSSAETKSIVMAQREHLQNILNSGAITLAQLAEKTNTNTIPLNCQPMDALAKLIIIIFKLTLTESESRAKNIIGPDQKVSTSSSSANTAVAKSENEPNASSSTSLPPEVKPIFKVLASLTHRIKQEMTSAPYHSLRHRPYARFLRSIISELLATSVVPNHLGFTILYQIVDSLYALRPTVLPSFAYHWFELITMPTLLFQLLSMKVYPTGHYPIDPIDPSVALSSMCDENAFLDPIITNAARLSLGAPKSSDEPMPSASSSSPLGSPSSFSSQSDGKRNEDQLSVDLGGASSFSPSSTSSSTSSTTGIKLAEGDMSKISDRVAASITQKAGWFLLHKLLQDFLLFLSPYLEQNPELGMMPCAANAKNAMGDHISVFYAGVLRFMLVLFHDFPEFLCEFHISLCDVIPIRCLQLRNLILSAHPRPLRLVDPLSPNLRIESLSAIKIPPRILSNYRAPLQKNGFIELIDSYLASRSVKILMVINSYLYFAKTNPDLVRQANLANARITENANSAAPGAAADNEASTTISSHARASQIICPKYSVSTINALVLYVGVQAITQLQQGINTSITHSNSMDILQQLAMQLDDEGRYIFINAIANHLRYPNSHTHYFSKVILYIFTELNDETLREQIIRVLSEKLILGRPHPWGVMVTLVELMKNPIYNFWHVPAIHGYPELKHFFSDLARQLSLNVPDMMPSAVAAACPQAGIMATSAPQRAGGYPSYQH